MSTYYTVKEHIAANDIPEDVYTELSGAIENMRFQFAKLGALMLLDLAYIDSMKLNADGKDYSFSGKSVTVDFQKILEAIGNATSFDLDIEYGFWHYGGYDSWDVGPFNTAACFESVVTEAPDDAKNFYYSMYNHCDSSGTGAGILCAYGMHNGKHLNGVVAPEITKSPKDGEWVAIDTSVVFDDDLTEKTDVNAIAKCVEEFRALGAEVNYTPDTSALYVNSITLRSQQDITKFIEICLELIKATDNRCGFMADFVDFSGKDARVLTIDFDGKPDPIIKVAEI
jgi:hypothetical protein